jgi:hypothetical protein
MDSVFALAGFLKREFDTAMKAFEGTPAEREQRLWEAGTAMLVGNEAEFVPLWNAALAESLTITAVNNKVSEAVKARGQLIGALHSGLSSQILHAGSLANSAIFDLERFAKAAETNARDTKSETEINAELFLPREKINLDFWKWLANRHGKIDAKSVSLQTEAREFLKNRRFASKKEKQLVKSLAASIRLVLKRREAG